MDGPLIALALRGSADQTLRVLCAPLASRAFGRGICPTDDIYSTGWISQEAADTNGRSIKADVRVHIQRAADVGHSFYAVAELDDGIRIEDAFEAFELAYRGVIAEKRSLSKTLTMAKARGIYPTFTNRPPGSRTVYVPLMLQSPRDVPFLASAFEQMDILFRGCRCKSVRVEYEGVFLDRDARKAMANLDYRLTKSAYPEEKPCEFPGHALERGSEEETFEIMPDCRRHEERLQTSSQATAIILSLHFDCPILASEHPLQRASIQVNCCKLFEFDAALLEEINWQRCGLIPPTDSYELREMRQDFLYLIPFSREAFSPDPPTAWICFDRFDRASLRINLARGYNTVTGVISIQTLNVRKYVLGMSGSMFRK